MSYEKKGLFKRFAKKIKASAGPGPYQVNGIQVICVHCRHDQFDHGFAQLNTALLSFLNLDFANRSANILICHRCGYIHWFNKDIKRIPSDGW
ncbi:hypothetical protein [Paenibacillus chibensis]|uniref:hypothetical protein n=1 Tax=Paenibacillus chibensis TaxID=59846 RepID=UPI000FD76B9C|nr:hypothetical protein [Paenibacillus chibensis]MEC0370619.1 hypothetical protein [Paenibacillus chibensis]